MKFFDEASNETTGPTSQIKEYDDLILCYQGSILEMYKQKAQLSDKTAPGHCNSVYFISTQLIEGQFNTSY